MHEASFYKSIIPGEVQCNLCPHQCRISAEKPGLCKVRYYNSGKLVTKNYNQVSAIALDPVEKKPFYHFYPKTNILSIGTLGCNLNCLNCQNENISQCINFNQNHLEYLTVEDILKKAEKLSPGLIAFTYNEPAVFYEFMYDIASEAIKLGVESTVVSNGYIMKKPLQQILPLISAFNIDLKSFNNVFYKNITGGSLQPVLNAIDMIKSGGKHLELTYLVIPGLNDDAKQFKEMIKYIVTNLGKTQVLHISRYYPRYKMRISSTPKETIEELLTIAKSELDFVYPGNTGYEFNSNTYCPSCKSLLIERNLYYTNIIGIVNNKCSACGTIITGKYA